MAIKGKYFPTQAKDEKVFLVIRRHWIIFFDIGLFLAILLVPSIVFLFYFFLAQELFNGNLGNFLIVFLGMYTLTVLGLGLYGFVNYYLDIYIVTNQRIVDIKQNGFFRREIAELHLRQIQDIEAEVEGFLPTFFHYGEIHIQTAGERENFIFQDVPHPYTLAKKIADLHQAQIEPSRHFKSRESFSAREGDIDDYRIEDYQPKAEKDPELDGSYHKEEYSQDDSNTKNESAEVDSGTKGREDFNDEISGTSSNHELSEGEEVTFDDNKN